MTRLKDVTWQDHVAWLNDVAGLKTMKSLTVARLQEMTFKRPVTNAGTSWAVLHSGLHRLELHKCRDASGVAIFPARMGLPIVWP